MRDAATTAPEEGSGRIRAKRATIATTLAAVAGFVDTAGFLTLNHVYTANMSGNTVQVGVEAFADTGGSAALHTTHVTGTITKFSEDAVQYVFALIDRRRGRRQPEVAGDPRRGPAFTALLLSAGIWAGFMAGAVLAGYLLPWFGVQALLIPIATVALIGIIDRVRPLAPMGL